MTPSGNTAVFGTIAKQLREAVFERSTKEVRKVNQMIDAVRLNYAGLPLLILTKHKCFLRL